MSVLDTLKYANDCLGHVCAVWRREPSDHWHCNINTMLSSDKLSANIIKESIL